MNTTPSILEQIDAAIVDLDGTMVDTLGDFDVALNLSLSELNLPSVTRAAIERMVGKGSEHLIASVLEHVSAPPELFAAAWRSYQRHYAAVNGQHSAVYPGVREGLALLKARGWRLACLTNKPLAFAQALLAHLKLDGYFDVVFGGDSFERKKPDPLPLFKTCEALGTLPKRTLMVGDSSNDAKAARAAGCPVWLVTYGYNHGEPIGAVDADGFADSIDAIAAAIAPRS
ncbi:MAG: phosphoglycolate phosphatase [Burkholderiales bacterium]